MRTMLHLHSLFSVFILVQLMLRSCFYAEWSWISILPKKMIGNFSDQSEFHHERKLILDFQFFTPCALLAKTSTPGPCGRKSQMFLYPSGLLEKIFRTSPVIQVVTSPFLIYQDCHMLVEQGNVLDRQVAAKG